MSPLEDIHPSTLCHTTMEKQNCTDLLSSIYPLDAQAILAVQERLNDVYFIRNEIILKQDEICNKLWFISEGLVRGYYKQNRREVTSWFAQENMCFYAADSFINCRPSSEIIQTIEPTKLMYLNREDLYKLYDLHPSINHVGRVMAERHHLANQENLIDLRLNHAKERLSTFARKNRSLFLRVPQKHIASHIGVSEGYISDLLGKYKV